MILSGKIGSINRNGKKKKTTKRLRRAHSVGDTRHEFAVKDLPKW